MWVGETVLPKFIEGYLNCGLASFHKRALNLLKFKNEDISFCVHLFLVVNKLEMIDFNEVKKIFILNLSCFCALM